LVRGSACAKAQAAYLRQQVTVLSATRTFSADGETSLTAERDSIAGRPENGIVAAALNTYAFIVGLENYQAQSKPIKPVAYAEADAKAVAKALEQIGFSAGSIEVLLSAQATKTSFESRFKAALSGLTAADSFVFFFAGHGLSINDQNYLTCHDTQRGDMVATSIRLDWIFQSIRKTKCKQATFFLDCCHSGLPIDGTMRGITDHISDAEFKTLFGSSEYHVAFAACKSDEFSYSSGALSHGIWTYHLLRALKGEAPEALDRDRFVTSHSLQTYLTLEVPRTLRTTVAGAVRQTPCIWGNATIGFIIADLKPILDARKAALVSMATAPQDAAFVGLQRGSIKSLSGFKPFHTVPKDVNRATQRFVAGICEEEVKEHANKVLSALRNNLGYGIKDVDRTITGDAASLKTTDFDVNISLFQTDGEPATYALRTEVTNFRNPPVVGTPQFNQAVGRFVNTLELQLPAKFDVEDLIAKLEKSALKDVVDIDFDTGLSYVTMGFQDTGLSLRFQGGLCEVTTNRKTNPLGLLEAVAKTQAVLLVNGSTAVPLLNP
jgi:hypothetical protein